MSYGIAIPSRNTQSPKPASILSAKNMLAMLGALLLATSLLFSGRASADPAVANQVMQVIRLDRQVFDMHLQIARQHATNGNVNAARTAFISAHMKAIILNLDLVRLREANQDSLDRGLYRDRAALERAIQFGQQATLQSQIVAMDLQLLTQDPLSLSLRARLDMDLVMLDMNMTQLEQAMRDA